MIRAGASTGFESPSGPMDDAEQADDRTVIPLMGKTATRRGVLAGGAAAVAAMLNSALYADGQSTAPTVGEDRTVLGDLALEWPR